MRCPVCPSGVLEPLILESGLPAHRCPGCAGVFLISSDYRAWVAAQTAPTPECDDPESGLISPERIQSKCCPRCQDLLLRHRIGLRIPFTLDHCARCSGVWLDGGEWASLKRRNLHDDVHRLLAEPWQRKLYKAARRAQRPAHCPVNPAQSLYADLGRIKAWMRIHSPARAAHRR